MRLNIFEKSDRWFPWYAFMETDSWNYYFYDYVYYNTDTFKVNKNQTSIGEIYWRMDGD